jgi:hypothetical protein
MNRANSAQEFNSEKIDQGPVKGMQAIGLRFLEWLWNRDVARHAIEDSLSTGKDGK